MKARGKQQPAESEGLQWNLAGDGLVVLRGILDLDTAGLQLEQFSDGKIAAAVAHGDDDPADAFALHELGEIAGVHDRNAVVPGLKADISRDAQAEFRALQDRIHEGNRERTVSKNRGALGKAGGAIEYEETASPDRHGDGDYQDAVPQDGPAEAGRGEGVVQHRQSHEGATPVSYTHLRAHE